MKFDNQTIRGTTRSVAPLIVGIVMINVQDVSCHSG